MQKQDILKKLYTYYPIGMTPIDNRYMDTNEFRTLEKKISSKKAFHFWQLILKETSQLYKNQIQDLTIFRLTNPVIFNVANPCLILSFSSNVVEFQYKAIFYLSLVEDLYCFSVKKISTQTFGEVQNFIDKNFLKLRNLNKIQKHEFFKKELEKSITIKDEVSWNESFPELQNYIDAIMSIIEKRSTHTLFDKNYLFEIVPNIATLSNQRLNTSSFFNCLFGTILE